MRIERSYKIKLFMEKDSEQEVFNNALAALDEMKIPHENIMWSGSDVVGVAVYPRTAKEVKCIDLSFIEVMSGKWTGRMLLKGAMPGERVQSPPQHPSASP